MFHLLSELLHLFASTLLAVRGLFVLAFFKLLRPLLHVLLNGHLFVRTVQHGVGIFQLLVVFLQLVKVFPQRIEGLVEAVLPRLDLFIGHQSQIGFLSQHLLLFGQVFKVFDGFVHLGFPLHLTELLKGSVKLFFHRVVVQLHVVQLLLHFLRIHLFHELLHLLIDLAHLFAHDVVHELLQLFLFVQDAFLLFAELVRALVLALVVTAHFFELFLQCLLLFHKVFHGRPVLPSHFTLLAQPFLHGLHRFPQFRSFFGGFFQGFFDALRGLDSLFSELFIAWCRNARGGGPHHFGTVDAVVVPELKPTLQDISFP